MLVFIVYQAIYYLLQIFNISTGIVIVMQVFINPTSSSFCSTVYADATSRNNGKYIRFGLLQYYF